MRKLTDCLKINKQIDKSNNLQIIGGLTRKPTKKIKEITSNTSIG